MQFRSPLTVHIIICALESWLSNGNPNKAAANVRKHGVQFSEAAGVFSDDYAITIHDDESHPHEQRFVTPGMGIKGRILVVVYCYSAENIRITSVPTAGRSERQQYEAQL